MTPANTYDDQSASPKSQPGMMTATAATTAPAFANASPPTQAVNPGPLDPPTIGPQPDPPHAHAHSRGIGQRALPTIRSAPTSARAGDGVFGRDCEDDVGTLGSRHGLLGACIRGLRPFLSHVSDALRAQGAIATGDGYVSAPGDHEDETALIYAITLSADERTGLDRLTTLSGVRVPDLTQLDALMIECRSGAAVARLGRTLAASLQCEVWFVDAAERAHPANEVDPNRLTLS